MNTWRKPKAFVCPVCEKDFNKESALKKHVKDAHGKELTECLVVTKGTTK